MTPTDAATADPGTTTPKPLRQLTAEEAAAYYDAVRSAPKRPGGWVGKSIHYTELPTSSPGSRLGTEWELYRREVGRLLAEGQEGKYILVKGEQIIGTWDTYREALEEGYRRFLGEPMLVRQILEREPLLRTGAFRPCLGSRSRSTPS